jgi:probable HAF family extracellular repeat protein
MKKKHILFALMGVGILAVVLLVTRPGPKPEVLYEVMFLPALGLSASPQAINDQGQVAGIAEVTPRQWHLFLWDDKGGMKDLGPCADARRFNRVLLNNAGQIAGTAVDPNGSPYAFLQDPNGTQHRLPTRAGEKVYISGLNRRGQVVGFSEPARGPRRAFLWDKTTGMRDLALPGTIEGVAVGINDAGQVVGYASLQRTNQWRAFLWDPNAGLRELGPSGFGPIHTCHINNPGFVVGQFGSSENQTRLSTWTPGKGVQRVRSPGGKLVQTAGLNDGNRFLVLAVRNRLRVGGPVILEHHDSYLCDPNGRVTELASCLDLPEVYEFLATGINSQGQIVGLLRVDKYANPQAVILVPIRKQDGRSAAPPRRTELPRRRSVHPLEGFPPAAWTMR